MILPVAGNAAPSGRVERAAFEYMAGRIVEAAAQGCDAILLDLHGAMVPEGFDDGEGELLARIRKAAPKRRSASRSTCTRICFPRWPRTRP
jgi:microcystin degradation protein MlrC